MRTLDQIGNEMGISRSQAANLLAKALRKIRKRFPNALSLMKLYADELESTRGESNRVR